MRLKEKPIKLGLLFFLFCKKRLALGLLIKTYGAIINLETGGQLPEMNILFDRT